MSLKAEVVLAILIGLSLCVAADQDNARSFVVLSVRSMC